MAESTRKIPPAPKGMATGGRTQWRRVVDVYDLRVDELSTLEDICRLTDTIDQLCKEWDDLGSPMMTRGSMGQEVTHPLVSEIRTHRMARNSLWRQLKLPELGAASKGNQQRQAAQSRWAAAHGRGASA